ncbi:MAG: DMT family transporter [Candidatus Promineofilum sp.]|nr:DMT family transporter [Promineifilum sp.]
MSTASPRARANLLLLLTAVIWGFAFVAQRSSMAHIGPFTFNAVRFLIGGLALVPLMIVLDQRRAATQAPVVAFGNRALLIGGALAGAVIFAAATFQQMGIASTTAGKAGFITSLYVVLVPLLGLTLGHRPSAAVWAGALLAAVGLYFLTIEGGLRMAWGDALVLVGAFLWAGHVLLIGHLSPGTDPVKLAFLQFMACAALSTIAAVLTETTSMAALRAALAPILYAGIMSVGVGYTLQVIAQSHARAADAAILLSLEAVFAVIGGWLLLGEQLSLRALFGCALMLTGILISQWVGRPAGTGVEISH